MKYNGWVVSDSFLKRAIAIWGYTAIGSLIIAVCGFVPIFIIGFLLGFISGLMG